MGTAAAPPLPAPSVDLPVFVARRLTNTCTMGEVQVVNMLDRKLLRDHVLRGPPS
jgi:hypothetical protein